MKNLKHFTLLLSILHAPFQGQCMIEGYAQVSCAPEIGHFVFYTNAITSENYYTLDCQHDDEDCFKAKARKLWDDYGIIGSTRGEYFDMTCSVGEGIKFRIKRAYDSSSCIGALITDFKLYYADNLIYSGEIENGCQTILTSLSVVKYEFGEMLLHFNLSDVRDDDTYATYTIRLDNWSKFPITLKDGESELYKKINQNTEE